MWLEVSFISCGTNIKIRKWERKRIENQDKCIACFEFFFSSGRVIDTIVVNHVQLFLHYYIFNMLCIAYLFKKNYISNKFVFIKLLLYEIIIHTFIIFLLENLRYNVSWLHDVFYIYIYFHLSISLGKQSDGRSCQAQEVHGSKPRSAKTIKRRHNFIPFCEIRILFIYRWLNHSTNSNNFRKWIYEISP